MADATPKPGDEIELTQVNLRLGLVEVEGKMRVLVALKEQGGDQVAMAMPPDAAMKFAHEVLEIAGEACKRNGTVN